MSRQDGPMGVESYLMPAFAKVNLSLSVLGTRDDGYHELCTVFQTVSLSDRLWISINDKEGVKLTVESQDDPMFSVPATPENLVYRAAQAFLERWGAGHGVSIHLEKRIPVGAGLGGGSSDAAAVLLALRQLLPLSPEVEALAELAAQLGADVPYFLTGGTALGTGRGDSIEPLNPVKPTELILAIPAVFVSTARVFGELARTQPGKLAGDDLAENRQDIVRLADRSISETPIEDLVTGNDLQRVTFELYEDVRRVYTALQQSQTEFVQLSGSGGCVFGSSPASFGKREVADWKASLPADCRVYHVKTMARGEVHQQQLLKTKHD